MGQSATKTRSFHQQRSEMRPGCIFSTGDSLECCRGAHFPLVMVQNVAGLHLFCQQWPKVRLKHTCFSRTFNRVVRSQTIPEQRGGGLFTKQSSRTACITCTDKDESGPPPAPPARRGRAKHPPRKRSGGDAPKGQGGRAIYQAAADSCTNCPTQSYACGNSCACQRRR